jgi:hypothetical protein
MNKRVVILGGTIFTFKNWLILPNAHLFDQIHRVHFLEGHSGDMPRVFTLGLTKLFIHTVVLPDYKNGMTVSGEVFWK